MKRIIDWLNSPISGPGDERVKAMLASESRKIQAKLDALNKDEEQDRRAHGGISAADRAGYAQQRRELQGHLDWLARGGRAGSGCGGVQRPPRWFRPPRPGGRGRRDARTTPPAPTRKKHHRDTQNP